MSYTLRMTVDASAWCVARHMHGGVLVAAAACLSRSITATRLCGTMAACTAHFCQCASPRHKNRWLYVWAAWAARSPASDQGRLYNLLVIAQHLCAQHDLNIPFASFAMNKPKSQTVCLTRSKETVHLASSTFCREPAPGPAVPPCVRPGRLVPIAYSGVASAVAVGPQNT